MTFGEKIKQARINVGLTQEELSEILCVSRSAIAKWEGNRGLPDVSNLKVISHALNVSVDYLLDEEGVLDLSVTKKPIDLTGYSEKKKISRLKKIEIKEKVIRKEYPKADITRLTVTKIENTKAEKIADGLIGWFVLLLGNIPLFGTQEFGKTVNTLDHQYYLVNDGTRQIFVLMTDELSISRTMNSSIKEKRFKIGDREFLRVGMVE